MSHALPFEASNSAANTTHLTQSVRPKLARIVRWLRPLGPRVPAPASAQEPRGSLADVVTEARLWRLRGE